MARTENQDFFGYWEPDDDREFDLKGRIVIVCDGMGGHAGGEIASRLAVQTIIETYKKDTSNNIEEALRTSIEAANAAIQKEAARETKLTGMGSTCTALVHRRDMVYFGQVGDSRGYLIRNNKIKQMTKDHSLVQELVDQGLIDKSEMESHPDKNVILRSLGVKPTVDVDVSYVPATPNDIFLICSDGLSGPVSEQEMLSIVQASNGDLHAATERLVELANRYGGFDNITVQCVKVVRTDTATTDTTKKETVTASFTPEQVQASIDKAKAEAAARAKPAPAAEKKTATGRAAAPAALAKEKEKEKEPPNAALAAAGREATADSMPTVPPTRRAAPARAGDGGSNAKLAIGLVIGLALGAVIGLVVGKGKVGAAAADDGVVLQARDAATAAEKKVAKRDSAAYKRGVEELRLGEEALNRNDVGAARGHFMAAEALLEVADR
jgi:protein phosphatase